MKLLYIANLYLKSAKATIYNLNASSRAHRAFLEERVCLAGMCVCVFCVAQAF